MNNLVGKIIKTIGMAIIGLGFLGGIVVWIIVANEVDGSIGFASGAGTFIAAFISGIMFVGFSEIIFLLQENINLKKKNTDKKEANDVQELTEQKNHAQEKIMPEINVKEYIKENTVIKENQIQCPYCGHIQNNSVKRCLSCSKMIIE